MNEHVAYAAATVVVAGDDDDGNVWTIFDQK